MTYLGKLQQLTLLTLIDLLNFDKDEKMKEFW